MLAPSPRSLTVNNPSVAYDGETTYCWGVRANVSASDVEQDRVVLQGSGDACPLTLQLTLKSNVFRANEAVSVIWTVAKKQILTSAELFSVDSVPYLVDSDTRRRATIIHSNLHACREGDGCGPFTPRGTEIAPTKNQIGNITETDTVFTSQELVFWTPGKYVMLAHIILPGLTKASRYDFAVYTTIDVAAATIATPTVSDSSDDAEFENSRAISTNQIVVLCGVAALILALLIMIGIMKYRSRLQGSCRTKRNDSDPTSTKQSVYSVHGSNSRTRSSDWTEMYAIEDELPSSILVDDTTTIAILRASRASTPSVSPSQERDTERRVADFRHDIARWDVRSSASPITPSSSALLFAEMHDPDFVHCTPANDCFVPLESLIPVTPPTKSDRSRRKQQSRQTHESHPEDSEDEQEVDI